MSNQRRSQSVSMPKKTPRKTGAPPRQFSVVGGTSALPSLREVTHRRNPVPPGRKKSQQQRAQSTPPPAKCTPEQKKPMKIRRVPPEAGGEMGFLAKMRRMWIDSDELRNPTALSDIVLHSPDGQSFFCSSFVLAQWSSKILDEAKCQKDGQWFVNVDVFSGEVLCSCLRFMYGWSAIDFCDAQHLNDVVRTAEKYDMEELKLACFSAAESMPLNVGNACSLLSFADKFQRKKAILRIERFIYANLKRIVSTNASNDWHRLAQRPDFLVQLFEASLGFTKPKKLVVPVQRGVKGDQSPSSADVSETSNGKDKGGNGSNETENRVQSVWTESVNLSRPIFFSDSVVVTKKGRRFHVHTQLISLSSPSFARALKQKNDSKEFVMNDIDGDVAEEFLRALYKQKPSENLADIADLVHILASEYEVTDLVNAAERMLAVQELTSLDSAVRFLKKAEERRMKIAKKICFRFLYDHGLELKEEPEWRNLIQKEPQLLVEMMIESTRFRLLVDEDQMQNE